MIKSRKGKELEFGTSDNRNKFKAVGPLLSEERKRGPVKILAKRDESM